MSEQAMTDEQVLERAATLIEQDPRCRALVLGLVGQQHQRVVQTRAVRDQALATLRQYEAVIDRIEQGHYATETGAIEAPVIRMMAAFTLAELKVSEADALTEGGAR